MTGAGLNCARRLFGLHLIVGFAVIAGLLRREFVRN
jgi:hypothetical protein